MSILFLIVLIIDSTDFTNKISIYGYKDVLVIYSIRYYISFFDFSN
jgi:hypothetical protein